MENWLSWTMLIVSIIHVLEEYFFGWIIWVQKYAKGVTKSQFIFVNFLFILVCFFAAIGDSIVFKLSIASLLFVNALIHIIPTVLFKHYSPGVISAIFLYIPISVYAYYTAIILYNVTNKKILFSILIGVILMAIPIIAQRIRIKHNGNEK